MQRISAASAARSSVSVLPMPENRILSRRNAGGQRPLQFAPGHHVRAGAEFRQRAQHRLVGVGLHGVAHQRLLAGKGLAEHPVMTLQRRGRIAIERRADRVRQLDQVHRLGVQHAVAIVEVIHGGSVTQERIENEWFLGDLWGRPATPRFHSVRIEHGRLVGLVSASASPVPSRPTTAASRPAAGQAGPCARIRPASARRRPAARRPISATKG